MRITLPKSGHDLIDALDAELTPAETEANVHMVAWKMVDAYLQGVRRFRARDRWGGQLEIAWENSKGQLDFRFEEVVTKYIREVGRYMKMDISPQATRKGESLGALRDAGISNAILHALASKIPLGKIHRQMVIPFLKYGTVGLMHNLTGEPEHPDLIEVVSPRQLRGFPAFTDGTENLQGIVRRRWVPMNWAYDRIKAVYDKKLPMKNPEQQMRARVIPWGSTSPDQGTTDYQGGGWGSPHRAATSAEKHVGEILSGDEIATKPRDPRREGRYMVPLEEIYVYDDSQQYVSRFLIKIGDTIIHDENFEERNIKVLCPLHIARHTDIGKFFARGFVSPLIPLNDQVEKMMANLFKNIAELDMFGTLFVPGASGIDIKKWKTGPRPKVEKYNPDPVSPNLQPFTLTPSNSGTAPARIAEFAMGQMERLSGQGPMFGGQTSGRVESAAGLGFLFNTANISLGLPVNGLADAYAGVYARMLQAAKDRMGPGDAVEITLVDDAIAGTVLSSDGQLQLTENPIPESHRVRIDIKDRTPRDRDIRKQELLGLYQAQLVDETQFWITAFEENLDFPGAPKEVWETWRKAIWQIIMLFRDGKAPGTVTVGEHTQNPDIQLIAVQRFMSKIEYSLASPEVRDAFEQWKIDLELLAGRYYPPGLPPPEQIVTPGMQPGQPTGAAPGAEGLGPMGGM